MAVAGAAGLDVATLKVLQLQSTHNRRVCARK